MDETPQWRFREMQPSEINVDPIEGQYFTTEAVGSITDALIRESIQNSLDALEGSGPVTVGFSFFSGPDRQFDSREVIKTYLDDLNPHLQAKHSGLRGLPSIAENLDYILIEDYGTRGLQGDVHQYDDLEDNLDKNDFYYFWRNIGRTRKGTSDLGRWGLGKAVFQAASRINSFFGFTVRSDDGRTLLMGQSFLKIHKVAGTRYVPYGYFGLFDGEFALPVEDHAYLEAFKNHFRIHRNDTPGLTVMIPYPQKEITAPDCIKSVIKHYFFPILAGKLVVVIKHAGTDHILDAVSMEDLLKTSRLEESRGMLGLLNLARWAIRLPEDAFVILKEPITGRSPKMGDHLFSPGDLATIKKKWAAGKRLAFHVPLTIRRQSGKDLLHTGFSVFLERDEKLQRSEDHFIRRGITIPEVTSLKQKGVRAIISITDPALSTFLGDAENPAHTDWERNSKLFKKLYKLGPSTLDFVKSSPREIVAILSRPQKRRDENLLQQSLALQPDSARRGDKNIGDGEYSWTRDTKYLRFTKVKGGFILTRNPSSKKVPRNITICMAYEVGTGDPFKKYSPQDFDVDKQPLKIMVGGARVLLNKNNVIQIQLQKGNFKLMVTGFEPDRRLRIKTYP
jgi:hypothetical protein